MATIKNYRDVLLQGAAARGVNLPSAALLLVASTPAFHVAVGGATDPASISLVATLVDLRGAITFSASGATLTSVTANSAVVTYSNMPGSTATVTASVTVNGTVFSKTVPISKVNDGANGSNGTNGAAGADGLNTATVLIYQRNNTGVAPALPSASSTYTFSTSGLAGLNNGWSVAVPAASGGAYLFVSKAIALSTTATDAIPAAEWSAASVMAQNGADALSNLIDVGWWKRDAAIPWGKNGTEYNRIIMTGTDGPATTGPKGGNDFVWYCEEINNNNNEGGGWEITPVTLDPTKTYRFAIPIKRLVGAASAYWGTGNVCTLNTATVASNPYFANASGLTLGRWYMFVGYLFPAGSTGNTNSGAGIYDCETGLLISAGVNYNMQAATTTYYHRCYQFYGSNGAAQIMGRPMVNLIDGAEPSLREYFSAAAVLNANQLWSDVSGAGKPSDNATSDINLIGTGVSVVGNKLVKTAATSAWDSEARSLESYAGGAFASAVAVFNYFQLMFGLNADPASSTGYASLDYAVYLISDGTFGVYESNVWTGVLGSYAAGDVFTVTYDGAYVRYMKNGVVFRSVVAVIVVPLFFDSSFYHSGAALSNARFGPLSQSGSNTPFVTSGSHMSVQGSTISKIGGAVAWDEGAWSQESYSGGAACSFIPLSGAYFMAGLNTDPTTDNNYTSIDYCFYSDGSANLYWYNSGATTGSFGTYVPGTDVLALTYDGQYVSWLKNGIVLKTLNAGPGVRFYFDASFAGGSLSNVKMGPMSAASTGIVFANSVGMSLSNGVFKKVGTTAAWDEQVISTDSFVGGAYASAKLISGFGAMFGLNADPNANASYTSLDYAFYWESGNVLKAYESNVDAGTIGTWAFGDILTISYDGVVVRYFQNGTLLRTVAAAYNLKFYFDSSFRDQGTAIGSVTFGPMSSTNWLAVGGDGKPSSYATVGPADAATSLGFNPQFSDWPTGQTNPTGWSYWSGANAAVKETSTIRTGPFAVKYTVAGDTGAVCNSYFANTPLAAGVYLRGSYDVYVVNHAGGTGKPGYMFRVYTNSALTTYRDTLVPALRNDVSGWQRVPFTANVNSGEQIYGITIYQMASYSGMPGGAWANGSIVCFDNLAFELVQPTTESQVVIAQPAITGLTSYTAAKANGTNVSYGSRTATMTNGVAPFSYSWTCELEYGSNLYITGGSTSSIVAYGTGTNSYVIGTIGVTVTDANGKTAIGSLSVYVPHGSAVPP